MSDINRDEILGAVARGWCHPQNAWKIMDVELAKAIAEEVMLVLDQTSTSEISEVI